MPESDRWKACERDRLLLELESLRNMWARIGNLEAVADLERGVRRICNCSLDSELNGIRWKQEKSKKHARS